MEKHIKEQEINNLPNLVGYLKSLPKFCTFYSDSLFST